MGMGDEVCVEVIGEGVESFGEAEVLCGEGCEELEGFYYGKAVGGRDMEKLIGYGGDEVER